MKDDALYLLHIRESIQKVESYAQDGRECFLRDAKTQDAILRNLHTLAESTQRLSAELKQAYTEIDWLGISGFRNVLVHDYLGINLTRVWEIVNDDLPPLKAAVEDALRERGLLE